MSKIFRKTIAACLFLLGLACSAPLVFAHDDWQPVDAADLKATSEPGQPSADAVILYREYIYDVYQGERSEYVRIKILTEKGRQKWGDVKIVYDDKHSKLLAVEARTLHPDGTAIVFDGQVTDKLILKGRHSKILARVFALPQVEVGSIVEYRYKAMQTNCCLPLEWSVQHELFQRKAYFKLSEVSMNRISWVPHLPPGYPKINQSHGNIDLAVENVPPLVEEEYMPPPDQVGYGVRFFIVDRIGSTDAFWTYVGVNWGATVEEFIGHSRYIADYVKQIEAPGDTPEQKSKKIYAEIQKLKRLSYSQELAAAENNKEALPDSAEKVLQQKRGYPYDLARVYVAMARAAGLKAYVMIVASRDNWMFEHEVLDAKQLDDEIAIVEIDGKDVALDPGCGFCPYGFLDWPKTEVQGIREVPGDKNTLRGAFKTAFAKTPSPNYRTNRTERIGSLLLSESGSLTGEITVQFRGQEAVRHRQDAAEKDEPQRAKDLEGEIRAWLPEGATASLQSSMYWDDVSMPLVVRFNVVIPQYASATGKRSVLSTALFRSENTAAFASASRTQPVYFAYPYHYLDQVVIQLPTSLQIEDLPKDEKDYRDFAVYLLHVSNENQALTIHREFAIGKSIFPLDQYPGLRSFYEQVSNGDGQQVVLRTIATGSGNAN